MVTFEEVKEKLEKGCDVVVKTNLIKTINGYSCMLVLDGANYVVLGLDNKGNLKVEERIKRKKNVSGDEYYVYSEYTPLEELKEIYVTDRSIGVRAKKIDLVIQKEK